MPRFPIGRFGLALLAGLIPLVAGGAARAAGVPCSAMPAGSAGTGATLNVIDPAALPTSATGTVDLAAFIAGGGLAKTPQATGIVHDGSSAALLVFGSTQKATVCFTAGADLRFEPFAPNFRVAVSPQRRAGTWSIPDSQLITVKGRYYGAVLVDTVTTPFDPSLATPAIEAGTCCWTTLATHLADQVPPVVLVHGLWGSKSSLSSVESYLTGHAPWNRATGQVLPIQYSITQPFDGPEPAATLYSAISGLLGGLAASHVVAGRVDIVAHSMGGLVARHYAGLATYRAPLNRGLGAFHTVVTLDTPELGSALAPFLLAHWNGTLQTSSPTPYGIWLAACGIGPDVRECFQSLGMPLAANDQPLDSGAVYSLVPNGPSLTSATLAPANIPGAAWRAIDAVAPGNSALYFEIDNLIAAIYSSGPPTIDQILQNLTNDAIVTVPSQTATASATDETSFADLSHTRAPDGSILDNFGLDDANVLASGAVDDRVGCWLLDGAPGACTTPAPAVAARPAPAIALGNLRPAARLAVTAPARLVLAQPAELPIRLSAAGLVRLTLRQRDELSGVVRTSILPVDRMSGPIAIAHVTPTLIGRVAFTLVGVFADGAISTARFTVPVDPPAAAPSAFQGDVNGRRIALSLSIPGRYRMFPAARFAGLAESVDLSGHVSYALATPAGAPAVRLTGDGALEAVHPGTAMVIARFGSAVDEIPVTVER